jgi:hypothetical protein
VQVDPIEPTLKALGTEILILNCDEMLSSFAFNFNLRRYTKEAKAAARAARKAGPHIITAPSLN